MTITIDLAQVARDLGIPLERVQRTVELLDEGNTVPFITRYRKDETGGLDEEQIRGVLEAVAMLRQLAERKATILKSIESVGKLTDDLAHQIRSARTSKHLEDLYLPFKPKKQTLATLARQRGLEPLALEILNNDPAAADPAARAAALVNPANKLASVDDVLAGVRHILAEQFSERPDLRSRLRRILQRSGTLVSVRVETNDKSNGKNDKSGDKNPERGGEKGAPRGGDRRAAGQPRVDTEAAGELGAGAAGDARAADAVAESAADAQAAAEGIAVEHSGAAPAGAEAEAAMFGANVTSPNAGEVLEAGDALSTLDNSTLDNSPLDNSLEDAGATDPFATSQEHEELQANADAHAAHDGHDEHVEHDEQDHDDSDGDQDHGDQDHDEQDHDDSDDEPDHDDSEEDDADDADDGGEDAELAANGDQSAGGATEAETAGDGDLSGASTGGDAASPAVTTTVTPKGMRATAIPPLKLTARQQARAAARDAKKKKRQKLLESLYKDYYNFKEPLPKVPPHRLLAINRGERSQVLRVRIEADHAALEREALDLLVKPEHAHAAFLKDCVTDALSRLVVPSLEREVRREMTDKAERHAVDVFIRNLRNLLLQPPVHGRRVLAIDPGFRSGCKLAILDEFGNLLDHGTIHIIGPEQHRQLCRTRLVELIRKYQISVLAIGNGTACRETEQMVADVLGTELRPEGVEYVIVNEAGASVYSTSPIGREELPKHDATVRSAASIGRRLLDPLSELVKINPANIGVGLYQHDLKAKHLRESLDAVVESCVNYVGVDVNTASPALLRYVSGLNQLTARRLYEYRLKHGPFHNREQLKQVPGFGDATYIQSAGFLKIYGGDNPLDATWIHPESYEAARRLLARIGSSEADLAVEVTPARTAPTDETAASETTTAPPAVFGGGVALETPAADALPADAPAVAAPDGSIDALSAATQAATDTAGDAAGDTAVATVASAVAEAADPPTVESPVAGAPAAELPASEAAGADVAAVEEPAGPPRVPLAERLSGIDAGLLASELSIGAMTLRDMLAALSRPRRDPREDLPPPVFRRGIVRLEDLAPGMELSGTVLNVVDFGVFVDIGLSDSALIHISRLADRFIKDPHEVVGIGDVMKVWVVEVDKARRRVSLTAIPPGSERPRDSRPPRGEGFAGGPGEGRGEPRGEGRGGRRGGPQGPGQGGGPGGGPAGGQGGGPGGRQGGGYAPGPGGAFGRSEPRGGQGGGRFGGDRGGPGRGGDRGPGGPGGPRGPAGNTAGSGAGPAAAAGGRGGFGGSGGQQGGPPGGASGRGYGGGRQGGGFQGEGRGGGRGGPSRGGNPNRQPMQHEVKPKKSAPERPITKGMIEGVEPMRTFGDLLQFYQKKKEGDDGDTSGPKPKS